MPRNWEDELYVKLYVRKDPEWYDLDFKSRGLFNLLLEVVDRSGMLKLGRIGRRGVAIAVRGPWDEVEPLLDELLEDGCLVLTKDEEYLVMPNFIAAQEAKQSPAARQKKRRERARAAIKKEQPSVVYFVAEGDLVKIGCTTNVEKRFKQLCSHMPGTPKLLRCVKGNKTTERNIHRRFAHLRQHGEWFTKCDELEDFIDALQTENDAKERHANDSTRDKCRDASEGNDAKERHALFLSAGHDQKTCVKNLTTRNASTEEIQQDELFEYERSSRIEEIRIKPSVCPPSKTGPEPEHTHSDSFAWKPEAETRPNGTRGVPRGWQPSADHRAKAEELGLDVTVELERWRLHPSNTKRHFSGRADLHDRFMWWLVESPRFGGRRSSPPTEPEMPNAPPLVRPEAPSDEEIRASRVVGVEELERYLAASTGQDDKT